MSRQLNCHSTFYTCKVPLKCRILCLVHGNGNLIQGYCQKVHVCVGYLDRENRFFANQSCQFLLTWSQSTNFSLRKTVQRMIRNNVNA